MKKQILTTLITIILLSTILPVRSEENTIDEKVASLKKRLENIDKQFADKERLQKEAETDPCLAATLQKREKAIENYELVLDCDDFSNSHANAEKYIKTPFKN